MSTVLVVQSDPQLHAVWARALSGRGHDVLGARSVGDGVALAREGGIDVVVVDSPDPGRSVRELVDDLDRLPDAPPVILVSSSPKAPELSAHLGAAAFVPKPCSPDDVVEAVHRVAGTGVRSVRRIDDDPTEPRRGF